MDSDGGGGGGGDGGGGGIDGTHLWRLSTIFSFPSFKKLISSGSWLFNSPLYLHQS